MLSSEQLSLPARKTLRPRTLPRWFLLLAALAVLSHRNEARGDTNDYALKAASLGNFAEFTDWPAPAFAASDAPLVIGILGKDPFGHELEDAVSDKKVNNRPVLIQRFRKVTDIKNCHILFISDSETKRLPRILDGLKGRSILTVSDMTDFTSRGGMVRLFSASDQIQFQVNLEVLQAAGLTMSSKLLRAAEIISSTKK